MFFIHRTAQIQMVVHCALRISASSHLVYVLRESASDGSYFAIAAIKRESMINEGQENQVHIAK